MDARGKIPALALLGLQFTTGCEENDPIVGTWSATQIGEVALPYMGGEGEYSYLYEMELRIGEGLTGQFWQRFEVEAPGPDYYEATEYDLEVIPDGAKYRIEVQQQPSVSYGGYGEDPMVEERMLVLDCELTGDQMRCTETESGDEYRWARKG